jgi:hypothetical protein
MIHSYKRSKWHVISIGQVCHVKSNNITEEFICCPFLCIRPKNILQPTIIIDVHHIIEATILLLHYTEVITKRLSTFFTKPKLSCLVNIISAISLSKGNTFKPLLISTTNELKFLLVRIHALSQSA